MTPREAQEYLQSFINYEIQPTGFDRTQFKLDRVHRLLELLGNPQKKLKFIHVAGSKGKGSTCAYTAYILATAGYRVGLYTSPHLFDFRERIRILDNLKQNIPQNAFDGKISEEELLSVLTEMKPVLETIRNKEALGRLSYFEVLTVLAIYFFSKNKVDFVVLEVGLGGRLDATNVVDAIVSVITPISLEHTQFLGNTIAEIAREKAAIIKRPQQKVVVAPQQEEAFLEIEKRSSEVQAKMISVNKDISYEVLKTDLHGSVFNVRTARHNYHELMVPLIGEHQAMNVAVALGVVEALEDLGVVIDEKIVREGLQKTSWPGRFEIIKKTPLIILDGAHNPASAGILVKTVKEIFPGRKVRLVLGISNDKDFLGIIKELDIITDTVIFTRADHPRACRFTQAELENLFKRKNICLTENVKEVMDIILKENKSNQIYLVTGSLFVVGEVRKLCIN